MEFFYYTYILICFFDLRIYVFYKVQFNIE